MCERCDHARWDGVLRPYSQESVDRISGSGYFREARALAKNAARKLWHLLNTQPYVRALGAQTGMQAVQMAKAGLQAVYCSGWQTAADANLAGETFPDQNLYPDNSVPAMVRRINNALKRADQIQRSENADRFDFGLPVMADGDSGSGTRGTFKLMAWMIEAGAAGVHFEDQLGSEKKCGHLGGKVLVPTSQHIRTLAAARLAADVLDVPTIIVARTDAEAATLLTSEIDDRDKPFILGKADGHEEISYGTARAIGRGSDEPDRIAGLWMGGGFTSLGMRSWEPLRTPEGYYRIQPGIESAIARAQAYGFYADVIWMETKTPDLEEAEKFAKGVHEMHPNKLLMYNCSPSFNWMKHFTEKYDSRERATVEIFKFQDELGRLGYKFNFVTLAGFHSLNAAMFELANGYAGGGMAAYARLQEREFEMEPFGFEAVRHQREVGTDYFDLVDKIASGGQSSTSAMDGSTEKAQFKK